MGMNEQTFEFEEGPLFHDWAATIKLREEERPFLQITRGGGGGAACGNPRRRSTNLWGETFGESHETNCRRARRPWTQIGAA